MTAPKAWVVQVFIKTATILEKSTMLYIAAFDTAVDAIAAVRAAVHPCHEVGDATLAKPSLVELKGLKAGEVRELSL